MSHPFILCGPYIQSGNSPLTHACVENDMELVKLFCDHGANINHQGVVSVQTIKLKKKKSTPL